VFSWAAGVVDKGHWVPDFFLRQASEQYKTCSQFLAQDLRHVIARAQTVQSLLGKCCLLPLNTDFICGCLLEFSQLVCPTSGPK
jgi:hypothetical protein